MNINPKLIYEAMKRVGFKRIKNCCDVEEKFCSTDEYRGELRALINVCIELHEANKSSDQLNEIARSIVDEDGENQPIRTFLMHYQHSPSITTSQMKDCMELAGWNRLWPDWVNEEPNTAHLTKGGAQSWIRYLFELEKK